MDKVTEANALEFLQNNLLYFLSLDGVVRADIGYDSVSDGYAVHIYTKKAASPTLETLKALSYSVPIIIHG